MLSLILGDFSSGKSTAILEKVKRDTESGRFVKLLVPEQETVTSEGIFTTFLKPSAQLTFEVTSFSRLANTAFRTVGGLAAANADKIARSLCMWRALQDVAPKLHRKEKPDQTEIDRYLQAVNELHAHAVTAESLDGAIRSLGNEKRLKGRLEDLRLVLSAFSATLKERTGGGEDELDRLFAILKKHRLFSGYRFFVDSFTSFTEQEYRILGELCSYTDVTVALCLPERKQGALCYEETEGALERLVLLCTPWEQRDILERRWRTLKKNRMTSYPELLELAVSLGAEVRLEEMLCAPHRKDSHKAALSLIRAPQHKLKMKMPKDGGLRLVMADNPFDGANFVASDIRKRVMEEGLRFRDFAIIAGRAQDHKGILDTALEKADVPFFFSVGTDPEIFEAVKLIHSAYAILRYGWQREDVITYLKCGLCGIEEEKADLFELYTETWNIHGKLFTRREPWEMNPRGFDDRHAEEEGEILATINEVRDRLVGPLFRLQENQKTQAVRLHAEGLYHYLCELEVPASLRRRSELERRAGRLTSAEEYERLWDVLMETLDRLVELLEKDEVSSETFHDLFSLALSAQSIGSIPSSVDQVTVGSADLLRISKARVVYLFDVADGCFPVKVTDDSYFSDAERQKLSRAGLALPPRLSKDASRALFCFLRALMKSEEETVLVHFNTDAALRPQALSREASRLKDMMEEFPIWNVSAASPLERLYAREIAAEEAGGLYETPWWPALRDAIGGGEKYGKLEERMKVSTRNNKAELAPETTKAFMGETFSVSSSAMEKFAACPMKYWCDYGLSLKPNQKAVIDSRAVGTYVHYLMESFFDLCEKEGYALSSLTEQQVQHLAKKAAQDGTQKLFPPTVVGQARAAHTVERLGEMALLLFRDAADEFAQSEFRPICRELHIGGKTGPEKVHFTLKEGIRLAFGGFVDRVDAMEKDGNIYFRVVDYKTGSKTFTPSDIDKGKNLQILLYLVALWKSRSAEFRQSLSKRLAENTSEEAYQRIANALDRGGEFLPACMEYLSLRTSEKAVDRPLTEEEVLALTKDRLHRSGLAIADEEVLRAMDRDNSGRFLPLPREEKTTSAQKNKHLFTLEQMEGYLEQVSAHVTEFGEAVKSGIVEAKPVHYRPDMPSDSPCKFCDFRDVCRARASK